ncbi:MAG: DUF6252 family protein [Flavobacteriales bacterium]|nr:DUF6252 family protein [Flavobacteriales bacterium]
MKFIYFLAASILIFVSCEKEDTTDQNNNNTPSFSWKIDGDDYTDNSPVIDINPSDVLTINASDNSVDITLIIYNFSSLSDGSETPLLNNSPTDRAYVTQNGVDYSITTNGTFSLSEKTESKLNGTFNFTSRTLSFEPLEVTGGIFSNITY